MVYRIQYIVCNMGWVRVLGWDSRRTHFTSLSTAGDDNNLEHTNDLGLRLLGLRV